MKYAINKCHGGFGLSQKALKWLTEVKGWTFEKDKNGELLLKSHYDLKLRCNKDIVECIELLGEDVNGLYAKIELIECPLDPHDGIEISDYDGIEVIQTIPKIWS